MRIYIIGNDGITLCRTAPAAVNNGKSPTFFRFSTSGRAFHSASDRLALSGAACTLRSMQRQSRRC